jgi:hypothetical protein
MLCDLCLLNYFYSSRLISEQVFCFDHLPEGPTPYRSLYIVEILNWVTLLEAFDIL